VKSNKAKEIMKSDFQRRGDVNDGWNELEGPTLYMEDEYTLWMALIQSKSARESASNVRRKI
jgi:hypothetical protein